MREARTSKGGSARQARASRVAGLYAVTPDVSDTAVLVRKVGAALDGGASVIQYRNKTADASTRRAQAQALARLHEGREGLLIVNDDVGIAAEIDADGVHLGEDDVDIAAARERLGADRLIGVSCYADFRRASEAVAAGADYVAFGSFFPSMTKPGARRAGLDLLQRAGELGVPVVAIGGIDLGNVRTLIDAGADAVAVVSAVFAYDDTRRIRAAALSLVRAFAADSS
jgi:thiamine-phosphate pyrophosphorylase